MRAFTGLIRLETRLTPESHEKVLLCVAEGGPQTKYDIEKKTKVNHASVHEAVKHLLNINAFEGEKVGVTRVGLPKVTYKLTFFGFCAATLSPLPKDMSKIAKNWGHLEPLLLGKWKYLVKKVGKEEAERLLYGGACVVRRICNPEEFDQLQLEIAAGKTALENKFIHIIREPKDLVKSFREEAVFALFEHFRDAMFQQNPEFLAVLEPVYSELPTPENFADWMEAFESDQQLKAYAMKYAEKSIKFANKQMKWSQFLKESFLTSKC